MIRLGVNIDHVATLRQARGGQEPDPVSAAVLAELGGADGITVHLREDRRHIQDRDVRLLRETVATRLNLEAAVSPEILAIALEIRPEQITFVPERRREVTTEGGLDVLTHRKRVGEAVARCRDAGLSVSLFIDPDTAQVEAAAALGAQAVELHTGRYAEAKDPGSRAAELEALARAGGAAVDRGLSLHAGHGLNYQNTGEIARLPRMAELNIGHSIVSRAVLVGLERSVSEMREVIMMALNPVHHRRRDDVSWGD
jgi:pyridoxine 5-phosphate synthase